MNPAMWWRLARLPTPCCRGRSVICGIICTVRLLITKHGHVGESLAGQAPTQERVQVIESAHPVPDESSLQAGQALIAYLQKLPANEPVLFLISGWHIQSGGSTGRWLDIGKAATNYAGVCWPMAPLSAKSTPCAARLSLIKGGKLWHYLGERPVSCLLMSDVPGDDPAVIGSGLLFPAPQRKFRLGNHRQQPASARSNGSLLIPCRTHARLPRRRYRNRRSPCASNTCATAHPASTCGVRKPPSNFPPTPDTAGVTSTLPSLLPCNSARMTISCCWQPEPMARMVSPAMQAHWWITARFSAENTKTLTPSLVCKQADAGTFLDASGDLIHTGPTGTNVMDVIIGLKL